MNPILMKREDFGYAKKTKKKMEENGLILSLIQKKIQGRRYMFGPVTRMLFQVGPDKVKRDAPYHDTLTKKNWPGCAGNWIRNRVV